MSDDLLEQAVCAANTSKEAPAAAFFDFEGHLAHQAMWSEATFGPGERRAGVSDHIRKELLEVQAAHPGLARQLEWIDVVILALDGAWRSGMSPRQIIDGIVAKQRKNESRSWPDWRTADPEKAIEHDRSQDATDPAVCEWKALSHEHFMRQCSKYPTLSASGPYCSNCGKIIMEAK